jgi:hypothetical protein
MVLNCGKLNYYNLLLIFWKNINFYLDKGLYEIVSFTKFYFVLPVTFPRWGFLQLRRGSSNQPDSGRFFQRPLPDIICRRAVCLQATNGMA